MPKEQSLIFAYILDSEGGAKKVGWKEIENWQPEQGFLWLHFDYTAKRTVQWFRRKSGLDKLSIAAMLAEDSRPRVVIKDQALLLFLRGVNLTPGQDPEDMVSVRVWLDENRIITTRRRNLLSVQDIAHELEAGQGPKTSAEFLLRLNHRLLDRVNDFIDGVEEQVDLLEEEVATLKSHLLRPKISDLRRQAVMLRRYLAPQREALYRLQFEGVPLLSKLERLHIQEIADRATRCVEDLDSIRDRASITQEELASRLAEQMDKRMYVLSVIAVIFLPLSFVTSLLGINVGGIPGSETKWAFVAVCLLLLLLGMMTVALLRWKKWM